MTTLVSDRIQFYAFSADKPVGKGVENIVKDPGVYKELNKIKNR